VTVRERAVGTAYAVGWSGVRRLPARPARALFDRGADLAFSRQGKGVRRLRSNLGRVVAATPALAGTDLDALTARAMRSYARYWREVFRLPDIPVERVVADTITLGERHLREAHAKPTGTILALPHMGNWDAAGAWLVGTGVPFTTVAERLEPAAVFDRFVAFRESLGMEVVPLTGGEQPPAALLRDRLDAGGMLCLLADRDLTTGGIPVDFFGATATVPAGPALLAIRTGATLIPVTCSYDRGAPWVLEIHEPVPDPGTGRIADRVSAMSQGMADAFARGIAAKPEDWHMLQRLWRVDLEPRPPAD
jgi:KDO2-lipid IV(A) lauroyltransferase